MDDNQREQNKIIRKKRIMKVFIEVAEQIIAEEGIGAVTTRKVAERAGYNSTSLYHYFDDLDHLIFLACLGTLDDYNATGPEYLEGCKNSVERYFRINERYFYFAYGNPQVFQQLFFTDRDNSKERYTDQYYDLFPERETASLEQLARIARTSNLASRNAILLRPCVEDGYITQEAAREFNEMSLMIYKCILDEAVAGHLTREEAMDKSMRFYRRLLFSCIRAEYRTLVGELEQ